MKNERKYVRRSKEQSVEFVVKNRCCKGTMINLSAGGAFIQTRSSFSVGDSITLIYQSGASATATVKQTATIKRTTDKGIGVEFKGAKYTDKNSRGFADFSTSKSVEFSINGRAYLGSLEDKNNNGVFIKTTGRFSEGQDISMTFESPKFGSEKKTGKIVRVTPLGIGVKFP